MTVAIGPIHPIYPPAYYANDLDVSAVADYVAGMIYAVTGEDKLVEMQECYAGNADIIIYAKNLAEDLKQKNWMHAIDNYSTLSSHLELAFQSCSAIDFEGFKRWSQIFADPLVLEKIVSKN